MGNLVGELLADGYSELSEAVVGQIDSLDLRHVEQGQDLPIIVVGDPVVRKVYGSQTGETFDSVEELFDASAANSSVVEAGEIN